MIRFLYMFKSCMNHYMKGLGLLKIMIEKDLEKNIIFFMLGKTTS